MLFPAHGIGGFKLLDLHIHYSPDQVYEHLAMLGVEGRTAYIGWALTSDLAFAVIYALALSVVLILILRELFPPVSRFRHLSLLPFLTVFTDWGENLSLAWVTHVFPARVDAVVFFASFLTSLKWIFIALTVLTLLAMVSLWAVSGLRRR